ncbi:hypothetical protein ACFVW1_03750 [Streptomyces olivochromogenes]|uniref:hypothetical protein n=1 Tax=Streptomyces olivochromogenes TaxID=1963 RepID=UPI0036D8B468
MTARLLDGDGVPNAVALAEIIATPEGMGLPVLGARFRGEVSVRRMTSDVPAGRSLGDLPRAGVVPLTSNAGINAH